MNKFTGIFRGRCKIFWNKTLSKKRKRFSGRFLPPPPLLWAFSKVLLFLFEYFFNILLFLFEPFSRNFCTCWVDFLVLLIRIFFNFWHTRACSGLIYYAIHWLLVHSLHFKNGFRFSMCHSCTPEKRNKKLQIGTKRLRIICIEILNN